MKLAGRVDSNLFSLGTRQLYSLGRALPLGPAPPRVGGAFETTMTIGEPTTMLTDYGLAALSLFLGVLLLRVARLRGQASIWFWAGALIATAAASLVGGTYHGFLLYFDPLTKATLWKVTVYTIGLVSYFMLSGAIIASIRRPLRRWLLAAVLLKLLVYTGWMTTHDDFRYAVFDYAPAMFAVLILQFHAAYRLREEGPRWILAGVVVSFAAAGIQQSGLKLHQNFNHNDLYHVIQMVAVYLFYKGGRLLTDR